MRLRILISAGMSLALLSHPVSFRETQDERTERIALEQ